MAAGRELVQEVAQLGGPQARLPTNSSSDAPRRCQFALVSVILGAIALLVLLAPPGPFSVYVSPILGLVGFGFGTMRVKTKLVASGISLSLLAIMSLLLVLMIPVA